METTAAPQGHVATILLVEDDNFISTYLEDKLRETCAVKSVTNAKAAREVLALQPVDLILLDILLPDENGFSLLEELKGLGSSYKDIPVLILSNLDQPAQIKRGKQLGAVDYLVKANYLPEDVVAYIRKILSTPQATSDQAST